MRNLSFQSNLLSTDVLLSARMCASIPTLALSCTRVKHAYVRRRGLRGEEKGKGISKTEHYRFDFLVRRSLACVLTNEREKRSNAMVKHF